MIDLTSGELAKLFKITKYTLRHYLKEGLLVPAFTQENGYQFFSEVEVYRLYQILFFRKLGHSIDEIKKMFEEEELSDHLATSLMRIEQQIKALETIREILSQTIDAQQTKLNEIVFMEEEPRFFKFLKDDEDGTELKLKAISKMADFDATNLEEMGYLCQFMSERPEVGYLSHSSDWDVPLAQGLYASLTFLAESDEQFNEAIESFKSDILVKEHLAKKAPLVILENVQLSLLYSQTMSYTIQLKIN